MPHRVNQTSFKKGHKFIKGGEKGWFKKGQKTWNKGTKGLTQKNKTTFKKGQTAWNKGKKRYWNASGSFKKGQNTLEKHWNWQGGISFEPYPIDWTDDLKESIRKRDEYTCQLCGIYQNELNEKLHCHHIDYDKDNLDPKNLISLCRKCHTKTNWNRDYWIKYFKYAFQNQKRSD